MQNLAVVNTYSLVRSGTGFALPAYQRGLCLFSASRALADGCFPVCAPAAAPILVCSPAVRQPVWALRFGLALVSVPSHYAYPTRCDTTSENLPVPCRMMVYSRFVCWFCSPRRCTHTLRFRPFATSLLLPRWTTAFCVWVHALLGGSLNRAFYIFAWILFFAFCRVYGSYAITLLLVVLPDALARLRPLRGSDAFVIWHAAHTFMFCYYCLLPVSRTCMPTYLPLCWLRCL